MYVCLTAVVSAPSALRTHVCLYHQAPYVSVLLMHAFAMFVQYMKCRSLLCCQRFFLGVHTMVSCLYNYWYV